MPAFAAQYQFAAAFTVFLVVLAGLSLVGLRGEPLANERGPQIALGAGFLGVGAAAFLQGSLLLEDRADPTLVALRLAGVAGIVVGSLRWRGSPLSRVLLWGGCAALVGALPFELADLSTAAASISAAGALLIGAALLSASRRAITARVSASAAGTLLLLVLVLSVAISTILADTAEDQALRDLDSRAVTEAGAVEGQTRVALRDASAVAYLLARLPANPDDPASPALLSQLESSSVNGAQRNAIVAEFARLRAGGYTDTGFLYVTERREAVASAGVPPDVIAALTASPIVETTLAQRRGGATVVVDAKRAFAVGARPLDLGTDALGMLLSVFALDDRYLDLRRGDVSDDAVALVSPADVVAKAGPLPETGLVRSLASRLLVDRRESSSAVTDDRFVAAEPVRLGGEPVLAVLSSRSTASVEANRKRLFQTFFVIAFGGTVLALLLAAFVGNRIGSGIRRLTTSVEAIQRGELGVRSGIRSEDEVGVLGNTFDTMAASIEEQTDALQEAAARVEAIVAGMGEALVAVDGEGRVTDFNAAAEELLDRRAADVVGRPVDEVVQVAREDGSDLRPRLRALERGRWSELAQLAVGEGAAPVPVALTAGALRGPDGEVNGGVIVLRDLRGEREVERMKRHFLSRVGHELRTPLTPLIGYSQMLAGRELPRDRAKVVYASILGSAKRLERIVEMLEFFASLDAGRQVLTAEPVDVRSVLDTVVELRAPSLEGTAHTLTRRVAKDTPAVNADRRWLGRSIDELVDNAVKFSPSGGRVVVSAGRFDDDPSLVEIAVRDAGVGMSPDEVDSAFTEWTQGDESDTRHFGGLGLGLALVQRVAEHHGGRVVCQTAPGKGSKFSILLPALAGEPEVRRRTRTRRSPAAGGSEP
jgi:PAS domain S-box-containing protein